MSIELTRNVFLWSTVINYGIRQLKTWTVPLRSYSRKTSSTV
jgi:hypothetical protein